ncbi:MAG TPA: hypothetical protein VNU47_00270 [Candidatus Paceibacterota bacterium]|nr:hypothetical protein [Candidatus Paceibacterota bacterium]
MKLPKYVVLEKPIGKTPLALIREWKAANGSGDELPVSFAGRLDPMASGKLLLLVGDECKKQSSYTGLDKEYEMEIVLDVETDTGDALGIPHYRGSVTKPDTAALVQALSNERGSHERAYPVYSSKTVRGKPLFMYALEGTLDSITIPTHTEIVHATTLVSVTASSTEELKARITSLLSKAPTSDEPSKALGADFRIGTIRPLWDDVFAAAGSRDFVVVRARAIVGSGTYMRTLANRVARTLGTTGIALSIHRTKIGTYVPLPFGRGLWTRVYR